MKREFRVFQGAALRTSKDRKKIVGFAAVFDQLSEPIDWFREEIDPHAFDVCLASNPDVRCLYNHNAEMILGRTKAGTLRLAIRDSGLEFDCDTPDTQYARDLHASIARGDISQASFGFTVPMGGDDWREETDAAGNVTTIRRLMNVNLFDVSPVTFPAYPQTSVSGRELWPDGEPESVIEHRRSPRASSRASIIPQQAPRTPAPASRAATSDFKTDAQRLAYVRSKLGVSIHGRSSMKNALPMTDPEIAEFRMFLATGRHQQRDLITGDQASAFVPEIWNEHVFEAMKAYDAVFNDDFTTIIKTDTGAPCKLFALDDTETSAVIVGEAAPSGEVDPGLFDVLLGQAPVWDSQFVPISYALLQDSAVDLPGMLAKAFGIRLARGISANLIPVLLAAAELGATATGDLNGTGATAANSVGYQDLIALRKSVDPAYRASGKASWLMNDNTLSALDSLCDKNGRPIIPPIYVDGKRMLLGYPVGICPSLPDIGASATPIVFGATGYFVVRVVKDRGDGDSGRLIRITQAVGFPENLLVGFKSFLRANGALLCAQAGSPQSTDSPIKYLQNAA
jgi:hypothetical protein